MAPRNASHVEMTSPRKRPRRNPQTHKAILITAAKLLHEKGYVNVTVEGIAAEAGAGKQTIYRWWPSKAAVVLEVYASLAPREVPVPDTGSVEQDLIQLLEWFCELFTRTIAGSALAGLIAEAQGDAQIQQAFREIVIGRRSLMSQILQRGRARGEIAADVDFDVVLDMLSGAIWYRLFTAHAPIGPDYARDLVRHMMAGIAAPARARHPDGTQL